jgi:coiled-coil and C2 domain-containing protein 2A
MEKVVLDILDDGRQRDVSVHQRYERHWLGGFKIPFQVVYKWSKFFYSFPYRSKGIQI